MSNQPDRWDVIVVGAGPAGSVAARQLALAGARVLLVDRSAFPRAKVCGCCLNSDALNTLESLGLRSIVGEFNSESLGRFQVSVRGKTAALSIPPGLAISRSALDWALIQAAIVAGAVFLPNTTASPAQTDAETRTVRLGGDQGKKLVRSSLVLLANGLGGGERWMEGIGRSRISKGARVGVSTLMAIEHSFYTPGCIYMACDRGGYAGLVRLEEGHLNIAAALDPSFIRKSNGAGTAVSKIMERALLPEIDGLELGPWHGTGYLTHQYSVLGGQRLLLLGDAAGYVEPFTGEGIAWALRSAAAVAPLAQSGARSWRPEIVQQWTRYHGHLFSRRWRRCRLICQVLRWPALMSMVISLLRVSPCLANPLMPAISSPDITGRTNILSQLERA